MNKLNIGLNFIMYIRFDYTCIKTVKILKCVETSNNHFNNW